MASKVIDELTDCSICMGHFVDPQILPCHHSFCKNCVEETTLRTVSVIKCPICKTVSGVELIKPDFRLGKILDALEQAAIMALAQPMAKFPKQQRQQSGDGNKCDLCQANPVAHWCEECSQCLCDFCKTMHIKLRTNATHSHRITAVSGKVDALETALQKYIVKIKERRKDFHEAVKKCQAGVDDANGVQVAALKSCNTLRMVCLREVNLSFDVIQQNIIDFAQEAVHNFDVELRKNITLIHEITKQKEEFQHILVSSENKMATEGEHLLEKAKIYLESLHSPDIVIQVPVVNIERNSNWKDIAALTVNMSGGAVHDNRLKLRGIGGVHWRNQHERKLPLHPHCLRVIKQQLWCCCGKAGIIVYSSDLQRQRTIPCGSLGPVHDVAEMSSGDVVIAAENGLYHFNPSNCTVLSQIDSGSFTSVAIQPNQNVYAFNSRSGQIRVYGLTRKHTVVQWEKRNTFKISSLDTDWITLSISNNQLKCCSEDERKIGIYSLAGKLLHTYGTKGSGEEGRVDWPYISDDDKADGSVLICDYYNNRLQVMTEEGEFSLVQLQPTVLLPTSATLFNNHLYVTSAHEKTITKYSARHAQKHHGAAKQK